MKLPAFEYAVPGTLDEALQLLAGDEDAKPLSGGQSLIPVLAFRLAQPSRLVDLRALTELESIDVQGDTVQIGARVKWRDILASDVLARVHPLLVEAVSHVAHYQVRNRGTIGGSLAHADSAAELPGIAVTCDADVVVQSVNGTRLIPASDFFLAPLTTSLEPGELITALRLPTLANDRFWGFEEFAKRRGDFALGGVAVHYALSADNRATGCRIGAFGVYDVPRRIADAEQVLEGQVVDSSRIAQAAAVASQADQEDVNEDFHATAAYRRSLLGTLVKRALEQSFTQPR